MRKRLKELGNNKLYRVYNTVTVSVHSNNIGMSVDIAVCYMQALLYSTTTFYTVRVLLLIKI